MNFIKPTLWRVAAVRWSHHAPDADALAAPDDGCALLDPPDPPAASTP